MVDIRRNVENVKARIEAASRRSGLDPAGISLVAVTKNVGTSLIRQAIEAGVRLIGENRVQEAYPKIKEIGPEAEWHMIGHLQTNKVGRALEVFDVIQSLDSERLAGVINERAGKLGKVVRVMVEVKVSPEETKFGFAPDAVLPFLEQASRYGNLEIVGLMAMAPYFDDPEEARPYFRKAREIFSRALELEVPNVMMQYLSMGMSDDFEVAISEGSNMVRIGRAIFSPGRVDRG
ncbi:MAG TPA: YggS family pyridoxal phosphate-dependent enzyme [Firmicutes bacterium]|nr:YggS family pyridoxal phosphate-dependent enzyme [Bacillota bacterium]